MPAFQKLFVLFLAAISCAESFTSTTARPGTVSPLAAENESPQIVDDSRRNMFKKAGAFAFSVAFTPIASATALDMEAFANAQVRK